MNVLLLYILSHDKIYNRIKNNRALMYMAI